MTDFVCTEHISLAYTLGQALLGPSENEKLYGVQVDQDIRGQNLQVMSRWGLGSDRFSSAASLKAPS